MTIKNNPQRVLVLFAKFQFTPVKITLYTVTHTETRTKYWQIIYNNTEQIHNHQN
jgi:hypothetical protein